MAMHAATEVPGGEHFEDMHITLREVPLDALACSGVGNIGTEANRYDKTITDQPVQVVGIEDLVAVSNLARNGITDHLETGRSDGT
jgi:hypothetical protein